jgi:hypothetical protein
MYIPNIEFSITWAPRFASLFAFLCSGILLAYFTQYQINPIAKTENTKSLQINDRKLIFYFCFAFAMQIVAYTSAYLRFVFSAEWPRIVWQESTPAKILDVLNKGESRFARTYHQWGEKFRFVANDLPDFYPIALSNYLHTYFHRHDTIFLPARKFASAWRMPRAVIVDHSDYSGDEIDEMQAMLPNSKKHDLGEFTLIVLPEDEKYFRPLIQNPS